MKFCGEVLVVTLTLAANYVHLAACGYNILMIPHSFRSHFYSAAIIANSLASRGHNATILLPDHFPTDINTDELDMDSGRIAIERFRIESGGRRNSSWSDRDRFVEKMTTDLMADRSNQRTWFENNQNMAATTCRSLVTANEDMFSRLSRANFDLAIIDCFKSTKCAYLVPHRLGIPWITYSYSADPLLVRVPWLPSFVPSVFSPFSDRMTFLERTMNTLAVLTYSAYPFMPELPAEVFEKYRKYGYFSSLEDLMSRSLLWLLATDAVLDYPRPMMPNMVSIGGLTTVRSNGQRYLGDIRNFIGDGKRNVILVSFGTMASTFPRQITEKFLDTFRQLGNYRIVWKLSNTNDLELPDNVWTSPWLPQTEILAHPAVKLFITHCGNNGQFEAVYHAVPMIGFPLFGDQFHNAKRLDNKGYGVSMNLYDFTSAKLLSNIRTILADKSYTDRISRASEMFRRQPQNPAERAAFWVEHVCQFGGEHLRSAGNDLSLAQYLMLDIFAALLIGFAAAAAVILITFKLVVTKLLDFSRRFSIAAVSKKEN